MIYHNPWEFTDIISPGTLQYLSIACTTFCNFNCTFCSKKNMQANHFDRGLLSRVLKQAIDLGLSKVELTGGEPFLYPWFWETLDFLCHKNVAVYVVTNGSLISKEIALRLAGYRVSVSVSLQTLDEDTFNLLSGTKGEFPRVLGAINYLLEAGYSHNKFPLIAIQSVASRDTLSGFKDIKYWAENKGCMFIMNRPIPAGSMTFDDLISGEELKKLLKEDHAKIRVPFSLDSACNRIKAGCYIDSSGNIHPCPSIDSIAGSLTEESLASIWYNSGMLKDCRNISHLLEGSCGDCREKNSCYGCRAVAWAVWGSLIAPDPGCFNFKPDLRFNLKKVR